MTAQHSPHIPSTVKLPIPVAPAPPVVVAPRVADQSSSSTDQPTATDGRTAFSIETDHLWAFFKATVCEDSCEFFGYFLSAVLGGAFMCAFAWLPTVERKPTTWSAEWFEGGHLHLEHFVRFLAKWFATICIVWPLSFSICAFGVAWFVVGNILLLGSIIVPFALVYSTYSTQTLAISSLFSLSARIASVVNFFLPVALLHLLAMALGPSDLPYLLPVLVISYANAFLLVLGTSFPHLSYRLFVLVRNIDLDGPGPLFPSSTGDAVALEEENKVLKKENEALKAQLNATN